MGSGKWKVRKSEIGVEVGLRSPRTQVSTPIPLTPGMKPESTPDRYEARLPQLPPFPGQEFAQDGDRFKNDEEELWQPNALYKYYVSVSQCTTSKPLVGMCGQ